MPYLQLNLMLNLLCKYNNQLTMLIDIESIFGLVDPFMAHCWMSCPIWPSIPLHILVQSSQLIFCYLTNPSTSHYSFSLHYTKNRWQRSWHHKMISPDIPSLRYLLGDSRFNPLTVAIRGSGYKLFAKWRRYPRSRLDRYLQNGAVIRMAGFTHRLSV